MGTEHYNPDGPHEGLIASNTLVSELLLIANLNGASFVNVTMSYRYVLKSSP